MVSGQGSDEKASEWLQHMAGDLSLSLICSQGYDGEEWFV